MSRQLADIRSHADLIAALRARKVEMELSNLALDELAGLTEGHAGNVLCGTKGLGRVTLAALLSALGVRLVLVEDPEKAATAQRARRRLGIGRRRASRDHHVRVDVMPVLDAWIAARTQPATGHAAP